MNKLLILGSLIFIGCVSATVDDDVSHKDNFSFNLPPIPQNNIVIYNVPLTKTIPIDVSKTVSKVKDTVNASIVFSNATDTLSVGSGTLIFVHSVFLTASPTGGGASIVLSDHKLTSEENNANSVSIQIGNLDTLSSYLSNGSVDFNISVVVDVSTNFPTSFTNTFSSHLSASADKNLL